MTTAPFKNWALNHIAHAVFDLDSALKTYLDALGLRLDSRETLKDEKVEVAFLNLGNMSLELISPTQGNHTLNKFLDKRGEGFHHICFEVPDINEGIAKAKAAGLTIINDSPRDGARNTSIVFIHPSSFHGILVEICSKK